MARAAEAVGREDTALDSYRQAIQKARPDETIDGFPQLKALALDCISLASFRRIDPEGIVAHQILCGVGRGERYVLIIEDLDLAAYPAGSPPARLYAIPLFPEGTD